MKKLSRIELDVVVNEVVNSIKKIEENKSKELFEKSENKDLFLSKVKEFEELEDKLDLLKKEIREIENKFNEDGLRVYLMNNRNIEESFSISLKDSKGDIYGLYKEIEKEIILSSLEELNVLVDGLDLVLSQTNKELDSMSNFKAKLEKLKLVNSLAVKLSLELESK
jgi:hypothetical protein